MVKGLWTHCILSRSHILVLMSHKCSPSFIADKNYHTQCSGQPLHTIKMECRPNLTNNVVLLSFAFSWAKRDSTFVEFTEVYGCGRVIGLLEIVEHVLLDEESSDPTSTGSNGLEMNDATSSSR